MTYLVLLFTSHKNDIKDGCETGPTVLIPILKVEWQGQDFLLTYLPPPPLPARAGSAKNWTAYPSVVLLTKWASRLGHLCADFIGLLF